jgi:hypothetical protein
VQGEVVREGDAFEYELGDKGFVRHKPKLGNPEGPIIAAWATASFAAPAVDHFRPRHRRHHGDQGRSRRAGSRIG